MIKTPQFLSAFYLAMEREGWGKESNHRLDPGKRTFSGISEVYWPNSEVWALLAKAYANPTDKALHAQLMDAVEDFYWINFWLPMQGDKVAELSQDIASEVFYTCVNMGAGVNRGTGFFQEALNLLNRNQKLYPDLLIDGKIGPMTVATLRITLSQRPPAKETTVKRILTILTVLRGSLWVDRMRKYPEREEFRGVYDWI